MPSQKGRTVRFNKEETEQIEEFLQQNPFLDFSTLARLAISNFIENPKVQIVPISKSPKKEGSLFKKERNQ